MDRKVLSNISDKVTYIYNRLKLINLNIGRRGI